MNPETIPPIAQALPDWHCCGCGALIHTDAPSRLATRYEDCLRRCDRCGIGISNARSNPTLIYREPEQNVPEQVRDGLRETASYALNVRNRGSKWPRIGYSTSEDALTWTVFTHLHRSNELASLFGPWLNPPAVSALPTLLLWGVPQPLETPRGADLRRDLECVCDGLGERQNSRSEPDVFLDFGPVGVIVIEVKYRSANPIESRDGDPFGPYLAGTGAFRSDDAIKQSGLYELARNWRIGAALAGVRPFTLLNLVVTDSTPERTATFANGLNPTAGHFAVLKWPDLLSKIQHRPAWFEDYLKRFPQLTERVGSSG